MRPAHTRTAGRWSLVAIMALLGGCIIVPTPEHGCIGPRSVATPETLRWLETHHPRREEVLFILGGPDAHTVDGRKFVYAWARIGGYFVIGGGYSATGGPIPIGHFLVVTFDDADRVSAIAQSRNSPLGFKGWGENVHSVLQERSTAPPPSKSSGH